MTAFLDWISQELTSASLWIQSPIVITASVFICSVLALLLLRIVDYSGAWSMRLVHNLRTKKAATASSHTVETKD